MTDSTVIARRLEPRVPYNVLALKTEVATMMMVFAVAVFCLGGFASLYIVSSVAEDSGLDFPEDRVYDRTL